MSQTARDLDWAMPVMRTGYAGRGLVYLMLAGFSLFAIWQGGQAQGTSNVLKSLETSVLGTIILGLIGLGMAAYAIWRVIDAIWDLEDYGSDAKGFFARGGMVVTGILHGGLGVAAMAVLFLANDSGGSTISEWTGKIMRLPAGRFIVGGAGLATVGAGFYYIHKAVTGSYRKNLQANEMTTHWNWVLKIGVLAQALIVTVIGGLLTYAAVTANPNEAGGTTKVFSFLATKPFGQVLVIATCLGLLCFSVFCFVNAAYRIIPKLKDPDIESLADWMKA